MFNFFVFLKIFIFKLLYFPILSIYRVRDDIKIRHSHGVPLRDRYGMTCFCGLAGSGKTMSLVYSLKRYRKKYGRDIYIFTNFPCKYADATFNNYKQLLRNWNKPVIVGWDELPNDFYKDGFKNFPEDLLRKLTQLRKNNGMKILYCCQDLSLVDVAFRRLTLDACDCTTFMGYLTMYKKYGIEYYFMKKQSASVDNKVKIPLEECTIFFQTKELRASYDTFRIVS